MRFRRDIDKLNSNLPLSLFTGSLIEIRDIGLRERYLG